MIHHKTITTTPRDRSRLLRRLKAVVGEERLAHQAADRRVYGYDASVFRGRDILAVAFPENVEEVAALVREASQSGLPFVARGAGTGLNGGALPQEEMLVIELSRMNRILEIDTENRAAVVEPGVVVIVL